MFQSGPVNITYGNTARFVVEYLSSSGGLAVPSSGTLAVSYTNTSLSPATDIIDLSLTGSFFIGTWGSSVASLGLATWVVSAPGVTSAATGQIRVIDTSS